eukprot:1408177-Ditylum_brightwellii.AAC.1
MDLLAGATCAQKQGLEQPTCKKYSCNWARWQSYVAPLGLPDVHLQTFTGNQKLRLLQTFMEAVRCGNFSQGNQKGIKGDTAQEAMDHVCAVLKESGGGNPSKTPAGRLKLSLAQQVH